MLSEKRVDEELKKSRLIAWLSLITFLIKSRSIVYGFGVASLGTFLLVSGVKFPDLALMSRLFASVYFLALATYLYNDLTDYEVDQVNYKNEKNTKVRERKQISKITVIFFALSSILSFSINIDTGFLSLIAITLAIFYSHPRTHFKNIFILKTVITGLGGVIASLMGATAAGNISDLALISSLVTFLFYFINGPLNDIRDIKGDSKGGRRTIPMVLGIEHSFQIIILLVFFIGTTIFVTYCFFGIHIIGLICGLAVCVYLGLRINKLSKNYEDKKKMNHVRTEVRNSIFYVQLSLFMGVILNQFANIGF
ncbi:MAG: UbiA prenyltransferase family protein [Thaumarchaeota archaeon]|nr:UbiA prenyltransferase family protein [Nitrososphaerota archaeon]